jgi:hypothetical protein
MLGSTAPGPWIFFGLLAQSTASFCERSLAQPVLAFYEVEYDTVSTLSAE